MAKITRQPDRREQQAGAETVHKKGLRTNGMKKFILVPDSYKGTMSSATVCRIMEDSIRNYYPASQIISVPIADGGEGSVDALLRAQKGKKVYLNVAGPYFSQVTSFYGKTKDGLGIIEVAAVSGFSMVGKDRRIGDVTTYGVGQLMRHALENGCRRLLVCLGGSAGNDMGAGAAAALGVKFTDRAGKEFIPVGNTLGDIRHIDCSGLMPGIKTVEIMAMCDVDNPLCGPFGAAYIYGPQKGGDAETIAFLDRQMYQAAEVIRQDLGINILDMPGAGAAGGMGGGLAAFLHARLEKGIELLLDAVRFESLLEDADLVISGEGCLDSQSLRGKVIFGVGRRTKKKGIPMIAVVGRAEADIGPIYENGVTAVFPINRDQADMEQIRRNAEENLKNTMDNIMRLIRAISSGLFPPAMQQATAEIETTKSHDCI